MESVRPAPSRRRRWSSLALVGCALLVVGGLSAGAVAAVSRAERTATDQVMKRRADDVSRTAANEVRQYQETLADLARGVGAQEHMTADDFNFLTSGLTNERLPGAGGISFVVAARTGQIGTVQSYWRERGSPALKLVPVGETAEHMFVVFDRPLDDGQVIAGRDLSQVFSSANALRAARDAGHYVVSDPYVLLRDQNQPAKQQTSFAIVVPVYGPVNGPVQDFRGWLVAGVRGGDFLTHTLRNAAGYGLRVRLSDGNGEVIATVADGPGRVAESLSRRRTVDAGDRQWQLLVTPTDSSLASAESRLTRLTWICGAFITLLMTAFVANLVFARNRALLKVDEATADLQHLAFHDSLTGLANRRAFNDRLQAMAGDPAGAVAVLFIDLDGFKPVNDALGHAAGDKLLCEVGARPRASVREGDTVARLGGDEFAVLAACGTDPEHIRRAAERIVGAVAAPYDLDGTPIEISASVGVAISTAAPDTEALIRLADSAMYEAKSLGKGCYVMAGDVTAGRR